MAHQARREHADELGVKLGVPVVYDRCPEPSDDPAQRWANGRNALLTAAEAGADWTMVIQADAIVCDDLLETMGKALDFVPDQAIVSAYLGTKRPAQRWYQQAIAEADRIGASWIRAKSLSWGVAFAVPTGTVTEMVRWADRRREMPYDMRVGRYYRDRLGWLCWHPWPSLVDHRQGPSLCGHDDSGRHAHRFHRGSGLTLSWVSPVADDPRVRGRG